MPFGDHGKIAHGKIRIERRAIQWALPLVIDPNEKEIRFGMPDTYEDIVSCVAELSTSERPLAISAEMKKGYFSLPTLRYILDIHKEYLVPLRMHSPDPDKQLIRLMGEQLASEYNTAVN